MTVFKVIVGLPGSGKTTLALRWLDEMDCAERDRTLFLDDLCLNIKELAAQFNPLLHDCVIITDPRMTMYAESYMRTRLIGLFGEHDFIFHYFENDPEACIINATRDPKPGGTVNFIKMATKHYVIPENSITYKVYRENVSH